MVKATGKYENGKMTGVWEWHRENGILRQTGALADDKKTGLVKRYHPNGERYDQSKYQNDEKIRECQIDDTNGVLGMTKKYKAAKTG